MRATSRNLWPTPLYCVDLASELGPSKEVIVREAMRQKESVRPWSDVPTRVKGVGLYESPPDFHQRCPIIVEPILNAIGYVTQYQAVLDECWCHVTNAGGYHDHHTHIAYMGHGICGILYVQVDGCTMDPPNGVNRFYADTPFVHEPVVDVEPLPLNLLLFSPHMRHSALPYTGLFDRVVVSFNALFKRENGSLKGQFLRFGA
jgi:hypothetical protein